MLMLTTMKLTTLLVTPVLSGEPDFTGRMVSANDYLARVVHEPLPVLRYLFAMVERSVQINISPAVVALVTQVMAFPLMMMVMVVMMIVVLTMAVMMMLIVLAVIVITQVVACLTFLLHPSLDVTSLEDMAVMMMMMMMAMMLLMMKMMVMIEINCK